MDFNKENINMVDAKKAKRLLLQPVSVMQWNGSILVSMHTTAYIGANFFSSRVQTFDKC